MSASCISCLACYCAIRTSLPVACGLGGEGSGRSLRSRLTIDGSVRRARAQYLTDVHNVSLRFN